MKMFTLLITMLFTFAAMAEEGVSGIEKFLAQGAVYASLVVMVIEFLIAKSILKSNSIIEIILNVIKFIFKVKSEKK